MSEIYMTTEIEVRQIADLKPYENASTWSQIQDRFFRECQAAGKAFGLTPGGE